MRPWLAVLTSLLAMGCAGQAQGPCPATPAPSALRVPEFPLAALTGPHAQRAKLYLGSGGGFVKYTVYVARAGIPDWVHEAADRELGKGEETEFEVEQYENGDTVYEVTRRVSGKRVELAVRSTDRKRLYIERKDLSLDEAPAAVKQAAAGVAGFVAREHSRKELDGGAVLHELEGELSGVSTVLLITPEGKITTRRTKLPAVVQIVR